MLAEAGVTEVAANVCADLLTLKHLVTVLVAPSQRLSPLKDVLSIYGCYTYFVQWSDRNGLLQEPQLNHFSLHLKGLTYVAAPPAEHLTHCKCYKFCKACAYVGNNGVITLQGSTGVHGCAESVTIRL